MFKIFRKKSNVSINQPDIFKVKKENLLLWNVVDVQSKHMIELARNVEILAESLKKLTQDVKEMDERIRAELRVAGSFVQFGRDG